MAVNPTTEVAATPSAASARHDFRIVEFSGLPGCGKTTTLDALRSQARGYGSAMVEVRCWSDFYGASPLARLPGRLGRYVDVLAASSREPRFVLALCRRALAAGYPATEAARWACQVVGMRQGIRALRRENRREAAVVVIDAGVCVMLTHLLHFGTADLPPYPRPIATAAIAGISSAVVHIESDPAECYERAISRAGWEHGWMRDVKEEKLLAAMERMHKDLNGLVNVVESIGIPTLRLPWETTVQERMKLVEDWIRQNQRKCGDDE